MAEEKAKLKKYWSEQAVALALQGRWSDAVAANQNILALFPSDAEAYNRLGKAYTELGKYADARDSYNHTLQLDPGNSIAEKNLQRLAQLAAVAPADLPAAAVPPGEEYLAPTLFIEEMGKTTTTTLINPAPLLVLAKQSAGDPVRLREVNRVLAVENVRGERLGDIEPKMGQRLISFLHAGNRYAAAISSLDNSVRIIVRETYQHPSQIGRVSFPAKGGDSSFRSYIKDSVLKYDLDDDEDDGDEPDGAPDDGAGDEAADEPDSFDEEAGNATDDK
jgi:tetratricopeptide (TPR) repeat protein